MPQLNCRRWVPSLGGLISVLFLAGCLAAGGYDAKLQSPALQTVPSAHPDAKTLLVVIRYPALFDRTHEGWFNTYHAEHKISLDPRIPNSPENREPFTNTLIKTNYYVMEFYETLRSRLPAHTVALQPQRLVIEGDKVVPAVAYTMPPAVVYVDFLTYVYPYKFMTSDSNTFGQYISPFIAVRTSPRAAKKTAGALAGTRGLRPKAHSSIGSGASGGQGYTYVDYLNDQGGNGADAEMPIVSEGPLNGRQYLEIPQVNINMGEESVRSAAATPGGLSDTNFPSKTVMQSLSGVVLQTLNSVNHHDAVRADFVRFIARFDTALSQRFDSAKTSSADDSKLALIREFIALEREFLTQNDQNLRNTGYRGAFGDSMRQLLLAEMQHHSDFWNQQIVSSLLILGTGLASGTTTGNYMPSSLWDIYFQSQDSATALNTAFERHFQGVRDEQAVFTLQLSRKSAQIKARTLQELREECRIIYAEEFGQTS